MKEVKIMNDESSKCSNYEGLFIFQEEEKLKEHLETCENCREEHEKQMKISSLVKEAAPYYLERERRRKMMRSARKLACCLIAFAGLSAFTSIKMYDNYKYQYQTDSSQESSVSEMGLPVDEYGFLYI